jgi:NADP-dependent aldehyde dehydrogenase
VGQALARHAAIAAIAFTGSRAGGTALMATAAARPVPIPVFAEMSSINPVIIAPGAASADVDALAAGFVGSLTLGAGQFCTNPGLLFVPAAAQELSANVARRISQASGQTMLTTGIRSAYESGLDRL